MMQKNNVLKECDFEKYEIVLPYKFCFGRNKNLFLCSELEKRHPCFSDEFCFDVRVKNFSKNGLCSDVFVINKMKLAEYEGKRRFSGSGFYTGKKGGRVFRGRKRRLLILIYFLIAGAIGGMVYKFLTGTTGERKGDPRLEQIIEDSSDEFSTGGELPVVEEQSLGVEFFEMIGDEEKAAKFDGLNAMSDAANASSQVTTAKTKETAKTKAKKASSNPSILSFEWRIAGFRETLSARVKNVFPEELNGADFQTVTYLDGVPEVTLGLSKKVRSRSGEGSGKMPWGAEDSGTVPVKGSDSATVSGRVDAGMCGELRGALLADGAVLISETFSPYGVEFLLPYFSCKKSDLLLFTHLSQITADYGIQVSSIEMSSDGGDALYVILKMDSNLPWSLDISIFDKKLNLFDIKKLQRQIL